LCKSGIGSLQLMMTLLFLTLNIVNVLLIRR
jgi:hypothetical protein